MKRELIENLTVESDEFICHITKKELSDGVDVESFFDKIKIVRRNDKKTLLSFKGKDDSESFIDLCKKIMPISGSQVIRQFEQRAVVNQHPVVPFTTQNPEMFAKQTVHPIKPFDANGLPIPGKINVYEVKEEGNGITAIVQVNKAEQEAEELARARAVLESKTNETGEDLLKKMAQDFKALTEDDLPPEKKKLLEEKKKKFPGFFNKNK